MKRRRPGGSTTVTRPVRRTERLAELRVQLGEAMEAAEAAASAYGRCRSPASRVRLLQALGEVREVRALMDDAEKWWSEVPCDV